MRRNFTLIALALGCAVALRAAPAQAKLRVAATTPTLAAIVAEVGGTDVDVTPLSAPTEDPHFVDARPDRIVVLHRADAVVLVGVQLEIGWLPALLRGARNARIQPGSPGYIDCSAFMAGRMLEVPEGPVDRAAGDVHPGGNPHYLYDARAAALVARGIGERLAALDTVHAQDYRKRAAAAAGRFEALAAKWAKAFGALPAAKRRVVAYHRSFPYLWQWLGVEEVATLEPKPGVPPSASHVAKVLSIARRTGAHVIVQEEYYPRRAADTLAKIAHMRVVVIPGAARSSKGQTAEEFIDGIAKSIHDAFTAQ